MSESRFFKLPAFDRVDVALGLHAVITKGDARVVRVEAERRSDLNRFDIQVVEGELRIKPKLNLLLALLSGEIFRPGRLARETHVHVALPQLTGVSAATGARVSIDTIEAADGIVHVASGAHIKIDAVAAPHLCVNAASGGHAELAGTCPHCSMSASSGGHVAAMALECATIDLHASSGSVVDCTAHERVTGDASSGAHIRIAGAPDITELTTASGTHLTMI